MTQNIKNIAKSSKCSILVYNKVMYRLSLVISEVYNKYLPLAEKAGITLNLDFPDTTQEVKDPEKLKNELDKQLESALGRSIKGEIAIEVKKGQIVIRDTGTVLSKPMCEILENSERITVTSRVGFGTKVVIDL